MNLNINTRGINTDTVTLTDYQMITSGLAKVVISYTGKLSKQEISAALSEQMKHLAMPVESSFREVQAGVAVGFVRSNRTIRVIEDDKQLRAGYRVMSSNIMMDNNDKTLWELKSGKGGKYLARHGHEDLSELIETTATHRADLPGLSKITMAKAVEREFVAFASASGDMDYGFCTRVNANKLEVVSSAQGRAITIPHEVVAQIVQVKILRSDHERLVKAGLSRADKSKEIEYYTRLYSYSPSYLADVIGNIEEGTMM